MNTTSAISLENVPQEAIVQKPLPQSLSLWSRQFLRGLSAGIIVLAVGGFVWLNAGAWAFDCLRAGLVPWTTSDVPLHYVVLEFWPGAAIAALLIAGALRVRRKAQGFRYSELRDASPAHRRRTRRIGRLFLLVGAAEGLGCWLVATLALHFDRLDLLWPGVGLVVSLHFLPLARIFHNPPYTLTGATGAAVSLALLLIPQASMASSVRGILLGLAQAVIMWVTAVYVIANADRLAQGREIEES